MRTDLGATAADFHELKKIAIAQERSDSDTVTCGVYVAAPWAELAGSGWDLQSGPLTINGTPKTKQNTKTNKQKGTVYKF